MCHLPGQCLWISWGLYHRERLDLDSQGHQRTAAGGAASQKQEGVQLCPAAATFFIFGLLCCLALVSAAACSVVL